MNEAIPHQRADRRQLQQIIGVLTEGALLLDPDRTIVWANEAALAMHGVTTREELGTGVDEYRERFILRYRANHVLFEGDYPTDRVVAGEIFDGVTVEVTPAGDAEARWVHSVHSHVSMIYQKIDVHRRSAAIVWARDRGVAGEAARDRGTTQRRSGFRQAG